LPCYSFCVRCLMDSAIMATEQGRDDRPDSIDAPHASSAGFLPRPTHIKRPAWAHLTLDSDTVQRVAKRARGEAALAISTSSLVHSFDEAALSARPHKRPRHNERTKSINPWDSWSAGAPATPRTSPNTPNSTATQTPLPTPSPPLRRLR